MTYKFLTKEEVENRLEIDDELFHGRIGAEKLNFHTACNIFSENLDEIIESEQSNIEDVLDKEHFPSGDTLERIKRLKKLLAHQRALKNPRSNAINPNMIEQAKQFPIQELFVGKLRKNGRYYKAVCPFHNETNESFTIDTKDNHFHCFGCHEHGDAINFYMKTNEGVSFPQAVKYLSRF